LKKQLSEITEPRDQQVTGKNNIKIYK